MKDRSHKSESLSEIINKSEVRIQTDQSNPIQGGESKILAHTPQTSRQYLCCLPELRYTTSIKRFKRWMDKHNANLIWKYGTRNSAKLRLKSSHLGLMEFLIQEASNAVTCHREENPNIPLDISEWITIFINRAYVGTSLFRSERAVYDQLRRLEKAGVVNITNHGNFANFAVQINPDILIIDDLKTQTEYQQINLTNLRFLPLCSSLEHFNKSIRTNDIVENSTASFSDVVNSNGTATSLQDQDENEVHYSPLVQVSTRSCERQQGKGSSAGEIVEKEMNEQFYHPQNPEKDVFVSQKIDAFWNFYYYVMLHIYSRIDINIVEKARFQELLWTQYFAPIEQSVHLKSYIYQWKKRVDIVKTHQFTHPWQAPTPTFFFDPENDSNSRFSKTAEYYKHQQQSLRRKMELKKLRENQKQVDSYVAEIANNLEYNEVVRQRERIERYHPHLLVLFEQTIAHPNFINTKK